MICIENQYVKACFSAKGAELQSLVNKKTTFNYIWCGNNQYWGKFSPVLFPTVGALKDNTYVYNGQQYELPRHGFARDMVFEYEQISKDEIVFTLAHSDETLKFFPFEFVLRLRYKLIENSLSCTYEVENPASSDLYFSIGGHPAFAVPLTEDEKYNDYFLQFNNNENLASYQIKDNLITAQTQAIALNQGKLNLTYELFYRDALVFKHLESNKIALLNTVNKHGLEFNFNDFPFFGIWSAKNANFVCLEPWCGIADGVQHNQEFTQKEGIIRLTPNNSWQRTWQVTCF